MTDESLKQLFALAAKATIKYDLTLTAEDNLRRAAHEKSNRDAAFVAACSPDVIAELVNELLAAREQMKFVDAWPTLRDAITSLDAKLADKERELLAAREEEKRLLKILGVPFCAKHDFQHCYDCELTEDEKKELEK